MISAAVTACTIQSQKEDPSAHPESPGPGQSDDGTQPSAPTTKSAVLDATTGATGDASADGDAAADGATAKDAGKDSGPACLGDDGVAAQCAGSKCEWDCQNQEPRWKRAVMADIASCLEMSPSCEGASKPCVDAALPKACADATAAQFCKNIVDSCAGNEGWEITQNDCVAMANALTEGGRSELLSCVNEGVDGYCRWDSAWCLEAMKW